MSHRRHEVTIVNVDPAALDRLGPAFKDRKIIGVGFDRDVLREKQFEIDP